MSFSRQQLPRIDIEFPRPIGVERKLGDFVVGRELRALSVTVKNKPGVLFKVAEIIASENINIAYITIPYSTQTKAVLFIVLEMPNKDSGTMGKIIEALEKLDVVDEVKEIKCITSNICTGSVFFPLTATTAAGERLVVFRIKAFAAMLRVLRTHINGLAPLILYSQGESYGESVAETIRKAFPGLSLEAQVKVVAEGYRCLGLGDVEYIKSIISDDGRVVGYRIAIRENWEALAEAPSCDMTRGMISGVLKGLLGIGFSVIEDRHKHNGTCIFRAEPL